MNLSHEYNEYIIGYVITDKDKMRTLNFQLEEFESNHPNPDWYLKHSCFGDETHLNFSENELKEADNYVKQCKDIQEWLKEVNAAKDFDKNAFIKLLKEGELPEYAFREMVNNKE